MNADKKRLLMVWLLAAVATAQTPQGVLDTFRVAAEALAGRDVKRFLEQFDSGMKDFEVLRQGATTLVGQEGAASSVEVVKDDGDDQRRVMEVDWLLRVGTGASKRGILKVTVERRGRGWKITGLEPVAFFGAPDVARASGPAASPVEATFQ